MPVIETVVAPVVKELAVKATEELARGVLEIAKTEVAEYVQTEGYQAVMEHFRLEDPSTIDGMSPIRYENGETLAEVPVKEMDLYNDAGLKLERINERDVLIRGDIDPNAKDARGNTNLERMERGLAPLDETKESYNIHHVGQESDGVLAELRKKEHFDNFELLHRELGRESTIDRGEFDRIRSDHWKERAQMMKGVV